MLPRELISLRFMYILIASSHRIPTFSVRALMWKCLRSLSFHGNATCNPYENSSPSRSSRRAAAGANSLCKSVLSRSPLRPVARRARAASHENAEFLGRSLLRNRQDRRRSKCFQTINKSEQSAVLVNQKQRKCRAEAKFPLNLRGD